MSLQLLFYRARRTKSCYLTFWSVVYHKMWRYAISVRFSDIMLINKRFLCALV